MPEEIIEEEMIPADPAFTDEERATNCRGSFKVGTACGDCARCRLEGYDADARAAAIAAETERTKDLPASRVKDDAPVQVIQVIQPPADEPAAPEGV